MTHIERLWTPRELAQVSRVSATTIRREVQRGRLKAVRIGDRQLVRVPESAWRAYLEEARIHRSDLGSPDDAD